MTNKEKINRNIGLSFDFVRYLINNPKEVTKLPNNFEIEFIEKDFRIENLIDRKDKKLIKVKNSFEIID